jgi:hypothetical protein
MGAVQFFQKRFPFSNLQTSFLCHSEKTTGKHHVLHRSLNADPIPHQCWRAAALFCVRLVTFEVDEQAALQLVWGGQAAEGAFAFWFGFPLKIGFFCLFSHFPFPGGAKGGPNGLGNCFALFVIECHNLKPFLVNFRPTGLRVDLGKFS